MRPKLGDELHVPPRGQAWPILEWGRHFRIVPWQKLALRSDPMPSLQVSLKKISSTQSSFHCQRPDGTEVWSRVPPFYPRHDLSHFAVETALGLRQGFYGLIAAGWDLPSFLEKNAARRLPVEAFWAECAVGVTELLNQPVPLPLAEWQAALDQAVAGQKLPAFRRVRAEEYARLIELSGSLQRQWAALPVGETLRLAFE